MMQTIQIVGNGDERSNIQIGEQTTELLTRFTKLDFEEKENLKNEAVKILSHCISPGVAGGILVLLLDMFKVVKRCLSQL